MKLPLIYFILYYVAPSPFKWVWLGLAILSSIATIGKTVREVKNRK